MDEVVKQALEQDGGGMIIQYKTLSMVVPVKHMEHYLQKFESGEFDAKTMERTLPVLEACYRVHLKGREATKDEEKWLPICIGIWFANEVYEGREKIEQTIIN